MNTERSFQAEPGHLYLVSTPIGNLGDFTDRARQTLASVQKIACEDTRVTGKLLKHLGLEIPMVSYRDENEQSLAPTLVQELQKGLSLALVADAGTPTLSDPGYRLVQACRAQQIPVVPIPGPFAAAAALSASGLPTDGFLFVGFLPPKRSARQRFFQNHLQFPYTLVFYESTHRIEKFLEDARTVFGPDRVLCLAREITKLHETFLVGSIAEVRETFQSHSRKGEFVVCIAKEGISL